MLIYERKLDSDPHLALREGSMHFEERSAVYKTLREITGRLDALQIPYAVVDDMALFTHGLRRFTEDVDLLVTRDGLQQIHEALDGRGYVPPFAGSKNLRDTDTGVRIEFLLSGEYPGDGRPKPVAFPKPEEASVEIAGLRCIRLPSLIELKLASGMIGPGRLKDLADVQELIRILRLPASFAEELDLSVRDKFGELWADVQEPDPVQETSPAE